MSWLDDLVDFGSSAANYFTGNSIGSSLARTALMGFALNRISNSINKENNSNTAPNIQPQQVDPDPNAKIPVVYGKALVKGIITDAVLTNGNQDMYFCLTLCEKTGNTGLGSGNDSVITFKEIYWNNQRLVFNSDGITVNSAIDEAGNTNTGVAGLIQVYCFNNGSGNPVSPVGYTNASLATADNVMPNWTANHDMSDLIFAIVKITYSSENNVNGLGEMAFILENTLSEPGDCLYDYMTNTRYGAGIDSSEIYLT